MSYAELIKQIENGETEAAVATTKTLETNFNSLTTERANWESKFNGSVDSRDKAKAKIKAIADHLGVGVEEVTPEKVAELAKSGDTADIEARYKSNLEKIQGEHSNLMAEKDEAIAAITLDREIVRHGIGADVQNGQAMVFLTQLLKNGASMEDGNIVYRNPDKTLMTGPDGKAISVKERLEQIRNDQANIFLFKPGGEPGGGSRRTVPVGGVGKKFSEMSTAERAELNRRDPAEYDRLKAAEQK